MSKYLPMLCSTMFESSRIGGGSGGPVGRSSKEKSRPLNDTSVPSIKACTGLFHESVE